MIKLNEQVDELKKKLIIETANKYFKELGYEKTQIEKISKELKIGVGTIYGYFKSKEGLFVAWLASVIDNVYAEMQNNCKDVSDPFIKIEKFVEYKVSYFEKNKVTIKGYLENNQLFLRGISRRKEHPMEKVYRFYAGVIREIKDVSECEAYLLANIFDGIINNYIECTSSTENLLDKKDEIVNRFLKLLEVER